MVFDYMFLKVISLFGLNASVLNNLEVNRRIYNAFTVSTPKFLKYSRIPKFQISIYNGGL